jgi:mono/diheme cytochrome c family protein
MPMCKTCILVWLSGLSALPLGAQVDRQYQVWMRSMFPSLEAIRNAPDNAAAAAAATKLADTFDQVAAYWNSKQSPDALGFAEAARDAARAIAAGNGDKTANLRKIQAQCIGCHTAHRGEDDPDRPVSGGKLPAGWSVIPDRGTAQQISYVLAGDVYHFAMGPGGTFYCRDWMKSGDYQYSARLTQKQAPTHPISYGLMIGGSDLASPTETYSYFLVRNTGEYFIANREGDRTWFSPHIFSTKPPVRVVDWTAHPAIVKQGADGRQTNRLGIQVTGDEVVFQVNGMEVTRLPKGKIHTGGMYGFRIGHNLDVDVDQVNR